MISAAGWPDSPLDAVDTAFADLTCDPDPLSLDLDTLAGQLGDDTGLPGGVIALPALRQWLLDHPRACRVRDVVWRELIRRRTDTSHPRRPAHPGAGRSSRSLSDRQSGTSPT